MTEVNEGIFTNQDEVVEGLRKSAEAVGIDPDNIIKGDSDEKRTFFAKTSCKRCYGRGFITMVPSPQKEKVFRRSWNKTGRWNKKKGRGRGPTKPKNILILSYSPETPELFNAWGGQPSEPEPAEYKYETGQKYPCKCLRVA